MLNQYLKIIDGDQLWWFHMVDECIFSLADKPENTISRIGGGKIDVGDDIANDLGSFLDLIKSNYDFTSGSDYLTAVSHIMDKVDVITKWSNDDYVNDAGWMEIREMARSAYFLRIGLTNR